MKHGYFKSEYFNEFGLFYNDKLNVIKVYNPNDDTISPDDEDFNIFVTLDDFEEGFFERIAESPILSIQLEFVEVTADE